LLGSWTAMLPQCCAAPLRSTSRTHTFQGTGWPPEKSNSDTSRRGRPPAVEDIPARMLLAGNLLIAHAIVIVTRRPISRKLNVPINARSAMRAFCTPKTLFGTSVPTLSCRRPRKSFTVPRRAAQMSTGFQGATTCYGISARHIRALSLPPEYVTSKYYAFAIAKLISSQSTLTLCAGPAHTRGYEVDIIHRFLRFSQDWQYC
jgi:hypothetical protein